MLVVIYYIIFAITILYGTFFILLSVIGLIKKSKCKFLDNGNEEHFFAVLIPARNEEQVIANLIKSLKKQNYPQEKYAIYVISNNCTDNTKKIALQQKANVLECQEVIKTKGDALKVAFKKLKNDKKIDAYIIFDADNVVHPNFLKEMSKALDENYNVAQGNREAKNPSDNWISGGYALFYLFQNVFYNKTRMNLLGSCAINGTGFMIKKDYIDKMGFETFTLTEDLEFTGQCALNDEKIAYVEKAITYDEYPAKFKTSWKQRKRWSSGIMHCLKLYFGRLAKKGKLQAIDVITLYLGPLMQVLSFLNLLFLLILRFNSIQVNDAVSNITLLCLVNFFLMYVLSVATEVIIVLFCKKNPLKLAFGILLFPLFIFTWIPINIICFIKKQTKWEEIKHDRNVKIHEVMK